jgi:hypothetical protein
LGFAVGYSDNQRIKRWTVAPTFNRFAVGVLYFD